MIRRIGLWCLATSLVPGWVAAQADVEINAAIEFDFLTPGARSLAMGGAFLALADDATAAFANPAGLTALTRKEVSAEYRHVSATHVYTDRGHAFGPPSGEGLDTVGGIIAGETTTQMDNASYASAVVPGKGWALALYRHQTAHLNAHVTTQGIFLGIDPLQRVRPAASDIALDIANHGASLAVEVADGLSLGVGLSLYRFSLDSTTNRFTTAGFHGAPSVAPGLPLTWAATDVLSVQKQHGRDESLAVNAGFLWRATDRISLGGVYRQGPRFGLTVTNQAGPASALPSGLEVDRAEAVFHVPDVLGAGLAVRISDRLSASLDYDRVMYSNLTDDMVTVFGSSDANLAKLRARDGNEFHFGAEYVFPELKWPIALRAGMWLDPAHRITHTLGERETEPSAMPDAVLFRPGRDIVHYAGGMGLVIGDNFQIDAAIDISERTDIVSVSGVFRLP